MMMMILIILIDKIAQFIDIMEDIILIELEIGEVEEIGEAGEIGEVEEAG
jgi:hypothetical protein